MAPTFEEPCVEIDKIVLVEERADRVYAEWLTWKDPVLLYSYTEKSRAQDTGVLRETVVSLTILWLDAWSP